MLPIPILSVVEAKVTTLDLIVTIGYMIAIVSAGCWVGVRHRKKHSDSGAKDYFLAGGTLKWPMIGMALFATNISCVHLVALAQAGYEQGLLMGNFEWMAAFTLVLLALFFAPSPNALPSRDGGALAITSSWRFWL